MACWLKPKKDKSLNAEEAWNLAYKFTSKWEGGWANVKGDRGGKTKYGVTELTWNYYIKKNNLPYKAIRDITKEEAKQVFKTLYWDRILGDELPPDLAVAAFDFAIHSGPKRAIQYLQRVYGIPASGDLGPVTIKKIKNKHTANLRDTYIEARKQFLLRLASKPGQAKFKKGWLNRIADLEKYVKTIPADQN